MITLDGVSKRYDGRPAVDCVSLTVAEGELCVLAGPSGCGKSTLLKLINRLVPLDSGTIMIGGRDITTVPVEELRRGIGYVIQSTGLFPHWTIADNIATVPRLLGWDETRIGKRVGVLFSLLGLDADAFAGKYPHQLSGGQQQRIGVARALAADPDFLLMDEPFGALDPISRDALQTELKRIQQATGKTIILVTHDIDEALRLGDRIVLMRDGALVQAGGPLDLLERPAAAFVHDFIGRSRLGLAGLAVRRVADHMRSAEGGTVAGEPIPRDLSLRDALSEMLLRGVDSLPVAGDDGNPAGIIHLRALVTR